VAKDLTSTAGVAGSFVGTANYMSPERALGKDLGSLGQFWKFEVILPGKDVNK
jgi:serine/threonine protein kinase